MGENRASQGLHKFTFRLPNLRVGEKVHGLKVHQLDLEERKLILSGEDLELADPEGNARSQYRLVKSVDRRPGGLAENLETGFKRG